MKPILLFISLLPLLAQQPSASSAKPEQKAAAEQKKDAPEASPVPTDESWLSGSVDIGYRWRSDPGGSFDAYRSIVNLGSGVKLLSTELTVLDPKRRLFDRLDVRAYNFGDDPYSTFHLDARKAKRYDLRVDYRNIAYFNFLPSYANPLLARGITLNEQSFDTHRRFSSFSIDLLPGNWYVPYFAYDRGLGEGTGVTAFVSDGNEYAVPNRLRDLTNLYRGGVRFALRRFHATLEQGGTTFEDNQSLFGGAGVNFGNVANPVFGQRLSLGSVLANYGISGSSMFSKGLFSAQVASWLDVYGQFLYSQPDSDVRYQQTAAGNLYLQNQVLFYNSQQYLVNSAAKLPHTAGSFGAEIRPRRRLRVMETWMTDRLHGAGSASSTQTLTAPGVSVQTAALLASSIAANYSQQEINVFFDATPRLTFRGGHRYVWGDANQAILPAAGLQSLDRGTLRRHVGIGSVTYRPFQKLLLTGEVEGASSGGAYFRTSLYDYQKVRGQARYAPTTSLNLTADFTTLRNDNPNAGARYRYSADQVALSVLWSPRGGKWGDLQGSYSRSQLRSDISFLSPQDLRTQLSLYRDNSHTATALVNVRLPSRGMFVPKLAAGGSFFLSSGSRPTSYFQPLATVRLPLTKNLNWFTEWRYYGYGETFYLYEGFRTHLVTTGLRLTR